MKLEKETALYNENAIANEVSNFTNEIVEINGGLQRLEQQIDGQVVTWFYNYTPTLNNLPASGWDSDEKELHLGDIFYNTTTYLAYVWSKSGSTYSWNRVSNKDLTTALQTANEALDTADKKRRVFISTSSQQNPTPPYDYGDIWFQGSYYDKDILTCVYADGRPEGASFVRNDWAKLNKYTDDSALTTFISGTYSTDKTNLQSQIDKKAETWYQSGDPSTAWTTEALKAEHEGDLWYNTTNQKTCRYTKTNNVYGWSQENVPTEVFDKIDGKAQIFTSTPIIPNVAQNGYNVGDLWFNSASSDILTCMTPKTASQSYSSTDWVKRNKYTDDSYARSLASRIGDTPQYFWHNESSTSGEGAGAHITEIPQEDFVNDPEHGGANLLANSDGIIVRNGKTPLASFGASEAQIGQTGGYNSRLEMGTDALKIIQSNGDNPEILMTHLGYGTTKYNSYTMPGPFYTLGSRAAGDIGYYSFAEGFNVIASGIYSHAENNSTASGSYSHAEGEGTASGDTAHAEGSSTASGTWAHAEGANSVASGTGAHASGQHTIAQTNYQTVIGAYNVADTGQNPGARGDFVFIIGNGSSSVRTNALTVDWSGNVKAAGSITAGGYPSGLYAEEVLLTDNKTINASSYGNASRSVAKTGYTPIGIVGMHIQNASSSGTNNTSCPLHSFYLSGTTAYWTVRNVSTSAAKIKVTATVLYVKS